MIDYDIVNFLYEDNDIVSDFIISYYHEYLSSNKNNKNIEKIYKEYILKDKFYKYVQEYFDINHTNNIFKDYYSVINELKIIYKKYNRSKDFRNSRWI